MGKQSTLNFEIILLLGKLLLVLFAIDNKEIKTSVRKYESEN